jgi:hypothetical protein
MIQHRALIEHYGMIQHRALIEHYGMIQHCALIEHYGMIQHCALIEHYGMIQHGSPGYPSKLRGFENLDFRFIQTLKMTIQFLFIYGFDSISRT